MPSGSMPRTDEAELVEVGRDEDRGAGHVRAEADGHLAEAVHDRLQSPRSQVLRDGRGQPVLVPGGRGHGRQAPAHVEQVMAGITEFDRHAPSPCCTLSYALRALESAGCANAASRRAFPCWRDAQLLVIV